ncbi:Acg family FMN-binding oxidoreductase [Dactylosporangium sp. CA-092794]|uniref:Acg family FMN-binding oxidoreductase n=1 Tax=Dactylosporangium sp. CA-092794 TaxID=3239929 RepID=UPI003D8B972C
MAATQPDPPTRYQIAPACGDLTRAALAALQAPSFLNTQPWRWRLTHDSALLSADPRRRLAAMDPSGRLQVLSCGAALHHACVALAAAGVDFEVEPMAGDGGTDLLAVVRHRGRARPSAAAQRLRRAIPVRRSDRRPFAGTPVPDEAIERLRAAAERPGAHLHVAWSRELTEIAVAAGQAADALLADPGYRAELAEWVRPPGEGHDGLPIDTLAPVGARTVPVRDFTAVAGAPGIFSRVDVADREARYGIIVTDGDGPGDWLLAGVALSAVLLTATADRLATSTMSDLVEHEVPRRTLRRMLGGVGYPAIGVRIGVPAPGPPPPKAPRRRAAEMIEVVADPVAGSDRP